MAVALPVINYRRHVPHGRFNTPSCISIFIAISLFTTLTEEHVLAPGNFDPDDYRYADMFWTPEYSPKCLPKIRDF